MALIPADIGLRLRQQNELLTQPVAPVQEIPDDLVGFKSGQIFSARIQEVLPENTYRALVAGKTITLSLPEAAKNGDVLELVVVDRTPKAIMAQLAPAGAGPASTSGATPYPHTTFSPTAQMLGKLLVAEGDTPKAAPLNRGEPLIAQPPRTGADLAQVLSKAVSESGLFYESHQAQWVAGKLPLANLLQEPQGRLSTPETLANHANQVKSTEILNAETGAAGKITANTSATQNSATLLLYSSEVENNAAGATTTTHQSSLGAMAPAMPDELRPLVQQQLDAAGSQRLIWHGEVWPGQTMQWEIDHEAHNPQETDEAALEPWLSTLRLSTPNLGQLEASLQLGPRGVRISVSAESNAAANTMRAAAEQLEQALAAAGGRLLGMTIKQLQPSETIAATHKSDAATDTDRY